MCTRPRRAHVSVGPSPSDDDSFRSGDERKRSPEVGGLADLPRTSSLVATAEDLCFLRGRPTLHRHAPIADLRL
jgi:hypothetical protein